ncbi:MAG: LysR family transcriptional regulator [Polyangiales bacterium]
MQESTAREGATMDWDDLRYVLAVARAGSLARASKALAVDHTTVGRRVEMAERGLGVRLFARTPGGYIPTADAERLLGEMRAVEDAVIALERTAQARQSGIDGVVRVTAPETFGCVYLAPRLALLRHEHPRLSVALSSTGTVLDLARREAEIAVRMFRTAHDGLAVRRVGAVRYGMYASRAYLQRRPVRSAADLGDHPLLSSEAPVRGTRPTAVDARWLAKLTGDARPALVCDVSMALYEACREGAGIAVLPRYLGDRDATLTHLPMPDPPTEPVWITVHNDMRRVALVRTVLDHLARVIGRDADLLLGT